MSIVVCNLPPESALSGQPADAADFHDSYRAPLRRAGLAPAAIFHGIFSHSPAWVKAALIVRNQFAKLSGLDTPRTSEILRRDRRSVYSVGEKIGPWPIFSLTEDELVAGRNNKHMDFRVSILKIDDAAGPGVVVSTICKVHNFFGKCYLCAVIPFHKYGVRMLMERALAAQRI